MFPFTRAGPLPGKQKENKLELQILEEALQRLVKYSGGVFPPHTPGGILRPAYYAGEMSGDRNGRVVPQYQTSFNDPFSDVLVGPFNGICFGTNERRQGNFLSW